MSGNGGLKHKTGKNRYIVLDGVQLIEEYAELLFLATEFVLTEEGLCHGILTDDEREAVKMSKWKGTGCELEGQIRIEEVVGGSRNERSFHYKIKGGELFLSTDSGRTYEPNFLEKLREFLYTKRGRKDDYRSHLEKGDNENPEVPEVEIDDSILERARKNYGRLDRLPEEVKI